MKVVISCKGLDDDHLAFLIAREKFLTKLANRWDIEYRSDGEKFTYLCNDAKTVKNITSKLLEYSIFPVEIRCNSSIEKYDMDEYKKWFFDRFSPELVTVSMDYYNSFE